MTVPAKEALWALTEKEKQTLRLIVRGHDAKSMARCLGLSVHTINERLRDARRKMAVSSSREAARLLLEVERGGSALASPDRSPPELLVDRSIGDDVDGIRDDREDAPNGGAGPAYRRPSIIIGVCFMTLVLGLLALASLAPSSSTPAPEPVAAEAVIRSDVTETARQWLALLDQGRWSDSYRLTAASFQKLNSAATWAAASEEARTPLGAVVSRTLIGQENLPAPPHGYEVVKFRTDFANKKQALETVSLDRESGAWRVVGVTIE